MKFFGRFIQTTVFLVVLLTSLISAAAEKQSCNQNIFESTPTITYVLKNDGTAIHEVTGLIWMRCSLGQEWNGSTCTKDPQLYTWGGALQAASRINFAGFSDWRVPNKNELETILEERCNSPTINQAVFPATPPFYFWTSSPYAGLGDAAWSIDFGYGSINASIKNGQLNVRLVRGGR